VVHSLCGAPRGWSLNESITVDLTPQEPLPLSGEVGGGASADGTAAVKEEEKEEDKLRKAANKVKEEEEEALKLRPSSEGRPELHLECQHGGVLTSQGCICGVNTRGAECEIIDELEAVKVSSAHSGSKA
jgi:hypothetical protein